MKYERLTKKQKDGTYYIKKCDKAKCDGYCGGCLRGVDDEIRGRLGQFEDKIENGTLVEIPCKVEQDDEGFLYFIEPSDEVDKRLGIEHEKTYLAFVNTVCNDFKEEYCGGEDEYYNRHFTDNDDTIQIALIKKR